MIIAPHKNPRYRPQTLCVCSVSYMHYIYEVARGSAGGDQDISNAHADICTADTDAAPPDCACTFHIICPYHMQSTSRIRRLCAGKRPRRVLHHRRSSTPVDAGGDLVVWIASGQCAHYCCGVSRAQLQHTRLGEKIAPKKIKKFGVHTSNRRLRLEPNMPQKLYH